MFVMSVGVCYTSRGAMFSFTDCVAVWLKPWTWDQEAAGLNLTQKSSLFFSSPPHPVPNPT